jgi:murein DD-endopeptidase MepM/ murein hydrolase activator NlpD
MKVSLKEQLLVANLINITLSSTLSSTFNSILITSALALNVSSFSVLAADQKAPTINISGEVQQGGLIIGKTAADNTVTLNDKKLLLSTSGDYAFGFSRDDVASYTLAIINNNGDRVEQILTPEKREYKIQRIEGIKKSIMKPNPVAVKRSAKDSKQVKAARKISTELTSFSGGFIAPIKGRITGVYGSQRVFNGVKKRPHFGLDYAGKIGDPVKAPAAGKVLLWVPDMFYSGGTMIIEHGQGISSTFLHLSKSYVKQGDMVKQGEVVAAVGNSGRTTGPHLDWRINWFDVKIDPALVLKTKPVQN